MNRKYKLGDKFKVNGLLTEVKFLNAGKAWVFPLKDHYIDGRAYLACASLEKLDEEGFDSKGVKAFAVKPVPKVLRPRV